MIVLSHGIQDTNELSHHSNQRNHLAFSPANQPDVICLQYRIMPNRYERRHKQSTAYFFSTPSGHTFAAEGSAVTCHRCNTNQCGDLPVVESAQFRQLRHQHVGGSRTNAGNRINGFSTPLQLGRVPDVFINLSIDGFQLSFDDLQNSSNAPLNLLAIGVFQSVGFGGMQSNQLASASNQCLEFLRVFVDSLGWHWFQRGGKVSDDTGIQLVGFGDLPCGPREVSNASGSSFRRACEDLARVGQIHVTHETMRMIVEAEGRQALQQQRTGTLGPGWNVADCTPRRDGRSCVITGADGVKAPLVTEQEKAKRRKRRRGTRRRQASRTRIRRGSDERYKEFKILTFYDKD